MSSTSPPARKQPIPTHSRPQTTTEEHNQEDAAFRPPLDAPDIESTIEKLNTLQLNGTADYNMEQKAHHIPDGETIEKDTSPPSYYSQLISAKCWEFK